MAGLIDHRETYGTHVIEKMVGAVPSVRLAADLGAGTGRDLRAVKRRHPNCHAVGIDFAPDMEIKLAGIADQTAQLDLERDPLPFADGSVDLIIANQVLEHTKEVFWIMHEVARCLAPGGHFVMGVPNVLSLHNRLLGLIGRHPTQHKLYSAHVRPFSRRDTQAFMAACSPGTFALRRFAGSQFYPFPRAIARPLARLLPGMAFSIFFDWEKIGPYRDAFLTYPRRARLETNFFAG